MNEVIVRMEMPEDCFECPFGIIDYTEDGVWCNALAQQSSGRREDCPIVCALPENHGRLIDADKIDYYEVERFGEPHYMVWKPHIDGQPTIVPATETEATPCH